MGKKTKIVGFAKLLDLQAVEEPPEGFAFRFLYPICGIRMDALPLSAKLFRQSFHGDRRSFNRFLLLDCFNNFGFWGFWRLMVIRKVGSQSSSAHLKSPSDICQGGNVFSTSKKPLSEAVEEQGSRMYQSGKSIILRPGMVLLKRFLTLNEQVSIVRECRQLGLGTGGFYWPNTHVMRMCLGLDWDSQLGKYSEIRRFDNSEVPNIPHEFLDMVRRAMDAAQGITKREHGARNVENILPMMIPDICLLNFYTPQGQLGIHQDRDESGGSLAKGLPIVSFSIGDSALFVYGDAKEISKEKKARKEKKTSSSEDFFYGEVRETRKVKTKKVPGGNKVVLDSGDVLIFGGPSRHIFHGLRSVVPRTAPTSLLKETGLLPGRLNLTFRQF